jgi:hypothetical protein
MVACSINFEDTVVALLLCFAVAELLELLELLSDQGLGEWGNVVATSLANTSSVAFVVFCLFHHVNGSSVRPEWRAAED